MTSGRPEEAATEHADHHPAPAAVELVIRPRPGWIAIDWKELWTSRELLGFLVWRDVKVRYKQAVLGVMWAVLQPLFTMLIFTAIFGKFAKVPSDGVPYAAFVFAGLIPWTFFSNSVTQASQSLINQQSLLTKIYLPRILIPAASIGGALVDLAISFGIFAVILMYYGIVPGWGVLLVPVLLLVTVAATLGIGMALAAITVTYRDFRFVVPFMIQSWLYISPVIYPVSVIPKEWHWALAINPMSGLIEAYRSAFFGLPWDISSLCISVASSVVLLVFGLFYFRKTERRFADIA
jgi:lipopolysaccharide transport system permease protein